MAARTLLRVTCTLALAATAACDTLTTPEKRVVEYSVSIEPRPSVRDHPDSVTTGDTLRYLVSVTSPDDPQFRIVSVGWSSGNDSLLRFVAATGTSGTQGIFFVRRTTGDAGVDVRAELVLNAAGQTFRLVGRDTLVVRRERFFGAFLPRTVGFLDPLLVTAPPEQRFGTGSLVLFRPDSAVTTVNAVPAIPLLLRPDTMIVLVPAGIVREPSPVAVTDVAGGRTVLSRTSLQRAAGDEDLDPLEPNDDVPAATRIAVPDTFALSLHGAAADVPNGTDRDLFTFSLPNPATLRFTLAWNVPSNLDFEIFTLDPLTGLRQTVVRAQSLSTSREETTATLEARLTYYLEIYPATYVGPTTYVLVIQ
jgi:hypothetical protein